MLGGQITSLNSMGGSKSPVNIDTYGMRQRIARAATLRPGMSAQNTGKRHNFNPMYGVQSSDIPTEQESEPNLSSNVGSNSMKFAPYLTKLQTSGSLGPNSQFQQIVVESQINSSALNKPRQKSSFNMGGQADERDTHIHLASSLQGNVTSIKEEVEVM